MHCDELCFYVSGGFNIHYVFFWHTPYDGVPFYPFYSISFTECSIRILFINTSRNQIFEGSFSIFRDNGTNLSYIVSNDWISKKWKRGKGWEKQWLVCRRNTLALTCSRNHLFGSSDHFQRIHYLTTGY